MGIPEEKENKVKAVAQVMLVREIVPLSPKSVVIMLTKTEKPKGWRNLSGVCILSLLVSRENKGQSEISIRF